MSTRQVNDWAQPQGCAFLFSDIPIYKKKAVILHSEIKNNNNMTENEKELYKTMKEEGLDTLVISDWELEHQGTPITHVIISEDIHGNEMVQLASGDPYWKHTEFFEGESVDYLYEKILKLW